MVIILDLTVKFGILCWCSAKEMFFFFLLHAPINSAYRSRTIRDVSAKSGWNTICLLVWRTNPLVCVGQPVLAALRVMHISNRISYGLVAKPSKFKIEWTAVKLYVNGCTLRNMNYFCCSFYFVYTCAVDILNIWCRYWVIGVNILSFQCSLNWKKKTVFMDSSRWYWITYCFTIFI